ncbi:hypothetical protein MPSEU_000438900 [Mayamaea pseudoterrestris]|nr:hypothetical protein MPSEU_000438900 [Mayamaea pseudoterrestris]
MSASTPNNPIASNEEGDGVAEPIFAAPEDEPPRLVLRNLPFDQSRNIIQDEHNHGTTKIGRLIRHDFFHVLLQLSTWRLMLLMLFIWTFLVLFFAAMYVAANRGHGTGVCNLGLPGEPLYYYSAFAFSLQTQQATGYGLPNSSNAFFEDCPALIATVYFQMTSSLFFNAFLIGVIISRISNSANRSVQCMFSKKAIVSMIGGQLRFQFRVFDLDSRHPVVEARVKLFAVTKDRPVPRPLRTLQPNDELGGMLFLSLPQVVSHHIDSYSLLHPPVSRDPALTDEHHGPIYHHNNHGLVLRQADSATCSRKEVICSICGATHSTHERWARHVEYMQMMERQEDFPTEGTHLSISSQEVNVDRYQPMQNMAVLESHYLDNISEVICVVEGIDPLTSGTFTALYSYRATDIVWDDGAMFSPCLRVEKDLFRVDLNRFHGITIKPKGRLQQLSLRLHDSFFRETEAEQGKPIAIPDRIAEEEDE